MTDLAKTIIPKSDQLNADDLIGRTLTVTITGVRGCDEAEQPVAVSFEGDNGKPYKPCKSMRRVMVHCWGTNGNDFAGRRMTLYRDEKVMFGGIQVGGIRISHMSHIDREMTMALTATRAKRHPYTVKPLRADVHSAGRRQEPSRDDAGGFPGDRPKTDGLSLDQRADAYERRLKEAGAVVKLDAIHRAATQLLVDLEAGDPERRAELEELFGDRRAILDSADGEPEA